MKRPPFSALVRYMKNRPGQFEYKTAIDQQLPIGSGKIESAHRSLIQKRLKLPGAWWKKQNADRFPQNDDIQQLSFERQILFQLYNPGGIGKKSVSAKPKRRCQFIIFLSSVA